MRKPDGSAERRLDASVLNEQRKADQSSSTDRSNQTSDLLRLNIEMAVEWAHLGGD